MNNARPPRITAAAGTRFTGANSSTKVFIQRDHRGLGPGNVRAFYRPDDIAGSGFPPLPKIPHCSLTKLGPCLSPNEADHPLRSAKHSRLGKLLSNQPPKTSYRNLLAKIFFFFFSPEKIVFLQVMLLYLKLYHGRDLNIKT